MTIIEEKNSEQTAEKEIKLSNQNQLDEEKAKEMIENEE